MRKREVYQSDLMTGIISYPENIATKMLVALHGIGSNEEDLLPVAEEIAPDALVISLRSPHKMGIDAYSFFHVDFRPTGNIHDWEDVKKNFTLLENELTYMAKKFQLSVSDMAVMGFSQGSIMTMGLLLQSSLPLGHYLCFSGRTLPEFADFALHNPKVGEARKLFLTHGIQDNVLSVEQARKSLEIVKNIKADVTYSEFVGGHGITDSIISDAKNWLQSK